MGKSIFKKFIEDSKKWEKRDDFIKKQESNPEIAEILKKYGKSEGDLNDIFAKWKKGCHETQTIRKIFGSEKEWNERQRTCSSFLNTSQDKQRTYCGNMEDIYTFVRSIQWFNNPCRL